jgi:anti-sigma-K factor RskA
MDERDRIDREIDALLDVEPSPDFVARVRAAVDARPIAGWGWSAGWRWMAIAASLVAAVVMLSLWGARVAPPLPPRPIVPEFAALEPPPPIVIEPITIAPLLTADIALGEQQ